MKFAALPAVAAAALAVAVTGGATSRANCSFEPPVVLPEPTHTRGNVNTIRWEHVPKNCWIGEDNSGKASTERRFTVTIKNVLTGATAAVTVQGEDEVDATIDANELPGGPGQVDGVTFDYVVVRKEKWCSSGSPALGTCSGTATRTSLAAPAVRSTQDMRAPTATLVLNGGNPFTGSLDVAATIAASDPGSAASGPGYVSFAGSVRRGGCGALAGCAQPLAPTLTVRLEPGADGPRTVEGRVFDRARGRADDPGSTTIGTPPGNVSAPFQATVFLDRTPPYVFLRASTVRVMVGTPVTFDASQSVDPTGSGVQPASGEWSFGDGGRATSLVATHTYTATGTFTLEFSVADNVGNVGRSGPLGLQVLPTPVPPQPQTTTTPPPPPTPEAVDISAPTLSVLAVRRRAGRTTLAFRLSERAALRVEVRRVRPRPTRRVASILRNLEAGRRKIVLPRAATRKPGRYAILLVARDPAGNVSRTRSLALTTRAARR